MLRRLAPLAVLLLAGCAAFRDAMTAHVDVVARAAGQELTVARLAELLAPARAVPLRREAVDQIAELWVDYQLLARALAGGDSLLDSATVVAAQWPSVAQITVNRLHDTLIVARARLTDAQVDSAYNVGEFRFLRHVLVLVPAETTAEARAAKRQLADRYRAEAETAPSFARVAETRSEDAGTAPYGGSLGLVARGEMVKPFEDAAWALRPGELSGVVETQFGFHIIQRPPLAEVRDSFAFYLRDAVVARLDSVYLDSLTNRTGIRVRRSAGETARGAARNLRAAKSSSRVMVTYRGGRLRASDFARWLQGFPAQTRGTVAQAPDSMLEPFLKGLARNDMLLRSAVRRGVRLTRAEYDSLRTDLWRQLGLISNTIGVSRDSLRAVPMPPDSDLQRVAAQQVMNYMELITTEQRRLVQVPVYLADVLRARFPWEISPAGVDRALAEARALRGPEEPSLPAMPPGMQPMTPAPSAPPPPGGPPLRAPAPRPPGATPAPSTPSPGRTPPAPSGQGVRP